MQIRMAWSIISKSLNAWGDMHDPENDYMTAPAGIGLINISLCLKILANFIFMQEL